VRERVFAQHPATPRAHLQYDPSRYPIQLGKYWLGPIDPTRPHDDPGGGYGVCTAVWAAFSSDRSTAPTQNWFGRGGRRCLTHQLRGGLAGSVKAGINSDTGERVCCKLSHEEYEGTEAQVYDCSIHCLLTVPRHQSSSQFWLVMPTLGVVPQRIEIVLQAGLKHMGIVDLKDIVYEPPSRGSRTGRCATDRPPPRLHAHRMFMSPRN
jgi:hypothetical protein